ncbi:MAG: YesL family protein, partial [Oscillospiraceae bacterium]|nr:YesL family protein [Oscillospiraceae bacterium]
NCMGLFYKNEVAGSGVSKDRSGERSFSGYWRLLFRKSGTILKINFVYFLFCLPVVTFGPATAAMTAMMRNIYLERPQFIFHDFFKLFKENFKKSLFIGILDVAAMVSTYLLLTVFLSDPETESAEKVWIYVCFGLEALFALANFYIYQQIAALDLPLGSIVKNSLILMCVNLKGFIVLVLFAGYGSLVWSFPLIALIAAPFFPLAWLGYTAVFCCYPTLQKHLINPYYERTGEKNPEIIETDEEKALFRDSGGSDRPIDVSKETRGKKVIK